jgi:hypothetical protein
MAIVDLDKAISGQKFAELVGVSRQAVAQMLKDGTLDREDTLREWLQAYAGHLREIAAGRVDTPQAAHSRERILAAEAQRREEQARMATLKRRHQAGELMPVDDCEAIVVSSAAMIRTHIWAFQSKLPPLLVGQDRPTMQIVLERETRTALQALSDGMEPNTNKVAAWLAKNAPKSLWKFGPPFREDGDEH